MSKIKMFLVCCIISLIFAVPGTSPAASKLYGFTALSGSGTGTLGAIDGTALNDKDMAVGVVNGISNIYYLDADSGAAVASPNIIAPATNAGTKRWLRSTVWPSSLEVSDQTSFDALAAVSSNTHVTVTPGAYVVSADMSIPKYVSLTIPLGVTITINTTKTLTINGPFGAGPYQVFSCADADGNVVLGVGAVTASHAEWFAVNTTPGTTDMTNAVKAARKAYKIFEFLDTSYKIIDTLVMTDGQQIRGPNKFPYTHLQSGLIGAAGGAKVVFAPASEKDFIDITTLSGAALYVSKIYVGGFHVLGNTTGGVTFSKYGINSKSAQSLFENLGFEQFQDGIYCNYTMTNKYSNVYLGAMSHAGIYTSTATNTTDTFDNVIVRASPWGAILRSAYQFRFSDCLWESLTIGGVDIYKESAGNVFVGGYAEDVPSTAGGGNYGMFYINKNGTTLGAGNTAIIGGKYVGGAGLIGGFMDVGETNYYNQVSISDTYFNGYTRGIRAAADTDYGTIGMSNCSHSSVTTLFTNEVKNNRFVIYGNMPNGASSTNLPTSRGHQSFFHVANLFNQNNYGYSRLAGMSGSLADEASLSLTSFELGDAAMIIVTANDGSTVHEAGMFSVSFVGGAASVIKIVGSANTAASDTDTDLCVFGATTTVAVRNRLGVTANVRILRIY